MNSETIIDSSEAEISLRFESLIGDLLARFLNCPEDSYDREIEEALRRIAECRDFDRGLVVQWTEDPRRPFVTHVWTRDGFQAPRQSNAGEEVPWIYRQITSGKIVAFSSVDDLPAEAETDKAFLLATGRKSLILLPLKVGGKTLGALAFGTLSGETAWPEPLIRRLQLIANVFAGALDRNQRQHELESQLAFESLVNEISARFVGVADSHIDAAIEDAQRILCERLDLDRSALFQGVQAGSKAVLATHSYQRPGLPFPFVKQMNPDSQTESYWRATLSEPTTPARLIDADAMYPWFLAQLRRRETVVVPDVAALREHAPTDWEHLVAHGTKSTVAVPFFIGDVCAGMLIFAAVRRRRDWPSPVVKRFQLIANVFAHALARQRTDAALRESESRYRGIFNAEWDAVLVADRESGEILDANAAASEMYGYSREEILRVRNIELSAEPEATLRSVAAGEKRVPIRWHKKKDGTVFPVELSANFVDVRGRKAYVLVVRDIAQRKKAEDALRDTAARLTLATESAGAGLWSAELRSRRVWFSPRMRELFRLGVTVPVTYEAILAALHPEERQRLTDTVRRAVEQGSEISLEHRVVYPDGSLRWISTRGRPHLDAAGKPDRILGVSIDITGRKLAQQRLEKSEQNFRQIAENIREVFYIADLRTPRIEYVSPTYEEIWGRSCQSLYDKPDSYLDSVHKDDLDRLIKAIDATLTGATLDLEYRVTRPDGLIRWVRDRGFPIFEADGKVARIAGLAEDITERKEAEHRVRESEARFRIVADSAPVLIWMATPDKLCNFFNQAWLDFTGRTLGQEMGNGWAESVHPDDIAECLKTYTEYFDARRSFTMEYRLRRHDGEYRWISDHGVPRYDAQGVFTGYIGSCVDTTSLRMASEALRTSEERFRQVAETVADFIWEVDANGLYTYTSPSVERILGYTPGELVGKLHFHDLFAPEVRAELTAAAFKVFAAKQPFRAFPNVSVRKQGTRVHLETSGVPILDDAGKLLGYRGADTDVTERKLADEALHRSWEENQRLRERLQAESDYLRTEIKVTQSFGEIIGQSKTVQHVLHQIEQVAPADCSVLINGETGTGKELIARAIHRLSRRKERAMVKVNCAALPSTLIESELFGRERGAFTGAMTSQVGRFEIADNSTIFLDEVGEISLEVQAKLLRVLQEGEFERLGSPRVRKVDVRVIAATNRDLAEEVRQGRFRQDLFYRLSVFPIKVPPLRDRAEDIPALVSAFVTEFSSRMAKKITKLPRTTMEALQRYSWPGNIRELRNVLEHGVILSTDEVLRLPPLISPSNSLPPATLADSEREHILKAVAKTGGRIKGPNGAAQLLGINPATLYSRMKKLGISNRPPANGV